MYPFLSLLMISNGQMVRGKKGFNPLKFIYHIKKGGPEGCSQGGKSSVKATSEDKEKFKELVSLLKGIGEQFAISVM